MMITESLQQVLERWKKAFGLDRKLVAAAERAVARWEWTGGERYSLLPFYFHRFPGRARALKGFPISAGSYLCYGFDELNRPLLHRSYGYLDSQDIERLQRDPTRSFDRDHARETFYIYTDNLVEIIEFSVPPRIPLKVQQIFFEDGRVFRSAQFRLNGYTPLFSRKGRNPDSFYEWLGPNGRFKQAEQYVYDRNLLARVLLYVEQPGTPGFEVEDRFGYDEAGKLQRIERIYENGSSQLLFRKREKGQTFQSLRDAAVRQMTGAIVERLRAEKIQEKLCFIELSYQAVLHYFPPSIVLGYENERQRLLTSGNPDARHWVFAPAMMSGVKSLEITDPDALEISSQLEQEIKAGEKWDIATAILREVAAVLTRFDWSEFLNVTPDFVVFAIDWELEGDDLAAVLQASASKEQLQVWKKKGWL